jgi:hypothetical protein
MALEGWDRVPRGYGAEFELAGAPWWLRLWFRTPLLDRYAHPVAVARGHGFLLPNPYCPEEEREVPAQGWRVREPGYFPPGSRSDLRSWD